MTLTEIIKADVEYMRYVTVEVDSAFGFVTISDDLGVHEGIFMQGEEAEEFIDQCASLYEEAGDALMYEVELHLAKSYVENIWGLA